MIPTIPIYDKVDIKIKIPSNNIEAMMPDEGVFTKTSVLKFKKVGLMITGDYLVIVANGVDEDIQTTEGQIFNMSRVVSYKTYKQKEEENGIN